VIPPVTADAGEHVVHFYADDSELVESVGAYLTGGVQAGEVAIVIATEGHREAFEAQLADAGIDPGEARHAGTLVSLDAAATLALFVRDGRVDREAFFEVIGGIVREAAALGRPVRAYGEMVALLWETGDVLAAIDIETLWNELGDELPFSLYCAYRSDSVAGHEHADALTRVCHLHSAVRPAPVVETTWEFAADRREAATARHLVADALRRAGHHRLVADAQLIVTELAANAVVHGGSGFSVTIRSGESGVRIMVRDASPAAPVKRHVDVTSPGGRGLVLIDALSGRWGVEPLPDGKVVWAELDC
jgi:anti-sigma regulatory factor (Ser/Thr protein kinase)